MQPSRFPPWLLAADPEQSTGVGVGTELRGSAAGWGLSPLIKRAHGSPALSSSLALGSQTVSIQPQKEWPALYSRVKAGSGWASSGGRARGLSSAGGCQRQDLAFRSPCLMGTDEVLEGHQVMERKQPTQRPLQMLGMSLNQSPEGLAGRVWIP